MITRSEFRTKDPQVKRKKFCFPGDVVLCIYVILVRCLIFQRIFNNKLVEAINIKSEVATILNAASLGGGGESCAQGFGGEV
jgi:hypothetical protein